MITRIHYSMFMENNCGNLLAAASICRLLAHPGSEAIFKVIKVLIFQLKGDFLSWKGRIFWHRKYVKSPKSKAGGEFRFTTQFFSCSLASEIGRIDNMFPEVKYSLFNVSFYWFESLTKRLFNQLSHLMDRVIKVDVTRDIWNRIQFGWIVMLWE